MKQRFRIVRVELIDIETELGIEADEVQQKLMNEAMSNDGSVVEVLDTTDNETVAFEYIAETKQIVVNELKA
jgi:hypothetical protein